MAWDRLITCSVAMVSGSASRTAMAAMERVVSRISWVRRIRAAMMKKNTIGPTRAPMPPSTSGRAMPAADRPPPKVPLGVRAT